MLEEVHVRNLALIEDAWLEFGPGMTALTGETGAGKTALLGALKLLVGERADSGAVGPASPEASVEGRFAAPDGEEIVASRRLTAEGRSRARIGGEMVSIGELAERLGPLIDLHGQHEHQALLSPTTHVRYLDAWSEATTERPHCDYVAALDGFRDSVTEFEALRTRIADATQRAEYLRFVAEEIGRVDPQPGEDDALEARLPALRHAGRIIETTHEVVTTLRGEGGALDLVGEARAELERLGGLDPVLDDLVSRVAEAGTQLDEIGRELREYRDGVEHDPVALDRAESRLSALAGLKKKYGPALADVIAKRAEAQRALADAEVADEGLASAQARVERAESVLRIAAEALDAARRAAAPGFVEALSVAVAELAMAGARFEVHFTEVPFEAWAATGPSRVEFLYAPAGASVARPLARIASGGEISRVMLAIKGVLGHADDVPTLVFDEVDAGIGGATAHAVGERLAHLARTHQVIVVTHLAQVAAYADAQLVVEKRTDGDVVHTSVQAVDGRERAQEIARMLSGSDTDESVAHAEQLLDDAANARSHSRASSVNQQAAHDG